MALVTIKSVVDGAPLVHDQSQFMSSTAVASAARRSDAPAPYAAAESEHRQIVAAARRSLKALGPDSTLKQLMHLEAELQRPLDDWKGVLKQAAEEYAAATPTIVPTHRILPMQWRGCARHQRRRLPRTRAPSRRCDQSRVARTGRLTRLTSTRDSWSLTRARRNSSAVGLHSALVFTALCTPYEVALVPASL